MTETTLAVLFGVFGLLAGLVVGGGVAVWLTQRVAGRQLVRREAELVALHASQRSVELAAHDAAHLITIERLSERLAARDEQLAEQRRERERVDRESVATLLDPLRDTLEELRGQVNEAERARLATHGGILQAIDGLGQGQLRLQSETANLVRSLRAPAVRGRWGELQLRRVVELAGLVEQCDFAEQASFNHEDGRRRPDLVVRLPAGRTLVVDAKAPLHFVLEAFDAIDEVTRRQRLLDHARQVRKHVAALAGKAYWSELDGAPELVVMFIPGEAFLAAALDVDPGLLEYGAEQRVLLATPTTLIALLQAVAFGWREERLAANAKQISDLGRQLHDRLRILTGHFEALRGGLDRAVTAYNDAVGSYEARVMVSARRLRELGATTGEDPTPLAVLDRASRRVNRELDELPALTEDGHEAGETGV